MTDIGTLGWEGCIYRILVLLVNTIEIIRVYCIYNGGKQGRARSLLATTSDELSEGGHVQ